MIHPNVAKAYEEIDAAMLSSDEYADKENREELASYLERWQRGLKEWEERG